MILVSQELASATAQLFEWETCQGRLMARCPSVPVDYSYNCSIINRSYVLLPQPLLLNACPL